MREISSTDIEAVTLLLEDKSAPCLVATDFTAARAALAAASILWLAGWPEPSIRGEYGLLLEQIVRAFGGITREQAVRMGSEDVPRWYFAKNADRLVAASREPGLHHTISRSGASINFDPPDVVKLLANNDQHVAVARRYYLPAYTAVVGRCEADGNAEDDESRRRRQQEASLRAALRRELKPRKAAEALARHADEPNRLWDFYHKLGAILQQHAPRL